jgi:hypothetical protein
LKAAKKAFKIGDVKSSNKSSRMDVRDELHHDVSDSREDVRASSLDMSGVNAFLKSADKADDLLSGMSKKINALYT